MRLPKRVTLSLTETQEFYLREHIRRATNAIVALRQGERWAARIQALLARISLRRFHEATPNYTLEDLLAGYHPAEPEQETDRGQSSRST